MLDSIIKFSLRNRLLVLAAAVLIVIAGIVATTRTEVDVFPDLNAPTVVVMTEAGGMAAEEVEQLVTFPIETAVNGSTGVRRVRSQSTNGFSVVWIEFDWDTDIYIARQIVSEKLAGIDAQLPDGVSTPVMGPQSSILGEVLIVSLTSDTTSMLDLRTMADWTVRPQLLGVGGVAQVSVQGGDIKEYQVLLSPGRMKHYGVTLDEVMTATRGMNTNQNGGVVYEYGNEYIVRGVTTTSDIDRIATTLVKREDGRIITLADIADVRVGAQEPKLGVASERGHNAVLLTVTKQPNTGTLELTADLDRALTDLQTTLPADVHISTDIFRQADFISSSINNVKRALIEGAFFVVIILFLFLANVRTTLISLVTIPLSFLVTVIVLHLMGISINTMTLGGLAIAIGSLVDDAIVDVENIHKRLCRNDGKRLLDTVFEASSEVRMPILNSTLIIVVSFVPLFLLDGMEGRMLIPLGIAFITALFASTLVALTLTPVLCSYLLRPGNSGISGLLRTPGSPGNPATSDSRVAHWLKVRYRRLLERALGAHRAIVATAAALFVVAVITFCMLGSSFLPAFNEGSFTINISSLPGVSLEESDAIGRRAEMLLLEVPEIKTVARKTGRAELDEHALGVNVSEIEAPFELSGRSHKAVLEDVRQRLSVLAGANIEIGQPITHRIDAMLSGTQASIAIKLFGTDLGRMFTIGNQIKEAIEDVPGIADLNVEQQIERPELKITPRRELLVQNGITLPEFNEFLAVNLAGETVSQVYESGHNFNLVVKAGQRATMDDIRNLVLDTQDGRKVPLTDIADIESSAGPNTINRENCQRKIVVSANTSGRALGDVVDDIRQRVAEDVTLPEGYRVEYGGQFESQQSAGRTLALTCTLSILIIFLLIFLQFRTVKESLVVLLNLPLALIGSVFVLAVSDGEVSIPAIIGFISLFGIATRNGMLLLTEYGHLRAEEGLSLREAIMEGSLSRLNPILMTALTSALALVPLALGGDLPGNEIQSPMARVILGGLISSTILNAFIVPIVYEWVMERTTFQASFAMKPRLTLLLTVALAGTSLHAQSLDEAVRAVERHNLQLQSLTLRDEAAILERRSENALGGPEIEYSPFWDNGKTGVASSELIVSQSFDFPTTYRLRSEAARREAAVARAAWQAERNAVLLDARLTGLDLIRANQQLDMFRRRLAECDTILHLLERRMAAGDATSLEINKARLTRMTVQQQLAETQGEREGLRAHLCALNGGEALDVTDNRFPDCPLEGNYEEFAADIISSNTDISVAWSALDASRHETRAARQSWLPQLSVGYRRNTEGNDRLHGFMVGAAFPLYSTALKTKAARIRQKSAEMALDAAQQEAGTTLRGQYNELLRMHSVLDHADTELLQETLELLGRALQYGEITALYYYTETADIYDKLMSHIDLHHRYARLYAEMHRDSAK